MFYLSPRGKNRDYYVMAVTCIIMYSIERSDELALLSKLMHK